MCSYGTLAYVWIFVKCTGLFALVSELGCMVDGVGISDWRRLYQVHWMIPLMFE